MSNTNTFKQQRQEVYRHIEGFNLEQIEMAKVMVVGVGALGNEVLKNLALLNIGYIVIVDFDVIEPSNLSRSVFFREEDCNGKTLKSFTAAKRVQELNPNIKIKVINGDVASDVGLGVFRRMDSILGCLDNMLARQSINRSAFKVGASWIDGGLSDTSGIVASYRQGHACYECSLSPQDRELIKERFSCPDKIRRYASMGRMPTTPINASIIGALQVQEAMNEINQLHQNSILGKSLKYFGEANEMLLTNLSETHHPYCLSDHTYSPIIDAPSLSADMAYGDFLQWAKDHFKSEDITLMLDDEYVLNVMSERTGKVFEIATPRLAMEDHVIDAFKQGMDDVIHIKDTVYELDDTFDRKNLSLNTLGVPHLHILRILVDGEYHYVELTGDEGFLEFT